MNEEQFKDQLTDWAIKVRPAIIPTNAWFKIYGDKVKTRIILPEHDELIYANIKPLIIDDEIYKDMSQNKNMDDFEILQNFQKNYELGLKNIRKVIISLQKIWSNMYCQDRAKQVMRILNYDNIYHVCDLTNDRMVPIELILKHVFSVDSNYGDHRTIKDKSQIYVDPRVLRIYNETKNGALNKN